MLFHVVNDRHRKKRAMIFTTNKPLTGWGRVLHDEDLAHAIVDRIAAACGNVTSATAVVVPNLMASNGVIKLPRSGFGDHQDLPPSRCER
jgi:DNA replication protein DnaC